MAKVIEWLKANYDRAAVMAAAIFLFISALSIWWSAIQFNNRLITPPAVPPKTASQPPVAVELDRAAEQLQKPVQWKATTRSGLFVPEKHFIGPDGMPATLQNTEIHPPVPNEWLEQFGLPIAEADVLTQDPDGDGEVSRRIPRALSLRATVASGRTSRTHSIEYPACVRR